MGWGWGWRNGEIAANTVIFENFFFMSFVYRKHWKFFIKEFHFIYKGDLDVRFIRNPIKEEFDQGKFLIYTNPAPAYNQNDFVPVPVKAGN